MNAPNYEEFGFERESEHDDREEFNHALTPQVLANNIQGVVDSLISRCEDVDWNEDLISFSIVKELRKILMSYKLPDIVEGSAESKFNFEAYKLTGKAEQSHGDIAFIVTRKLPGDGALVSGVAFYEAKASGTGYESYGYPSFDVQQLRRLVTNTPKLSYLFYSREKRDVGATDWPMSSPYYKEAKWRHTDRNRVHALTIDANFLKQCRSIDTASLTFGQRFGDHFVQRVLSGRDLDYSRSVEQTIRRWLKCTKRSAPLVVSVSVFEEKEEHFSTQLKLPGLEKVKFSEPINVDTNKLNAKSTQDY